ncbi:MAG: helix-turn-helix transcriptional regulator [Spirochaetia bacterium]
MKPADYIAKMCPDLAERSREIQSFIAFLNIDDPVAFLAVSGTPGSGRSRLLDEFESLCKVIGMTPLSHLFHEEDSTRAGKVWENFTGFSAGGAGPEALIHRARLLSSDIVLLLDDIHHADSEFLGDIIKVCPEVKDFHLRIVFSYWDCPSYFAPHLTGFLSAVRHDFSYNEIYLQNLSRTGAEEMTRALLGRRWNTTLFRRIYDKTEGNPLFLKEVCRIITGRYTGTKDDILEALDTTIPREIFILISKMLERLSAPARSIIDTASLLDYEFREADIPLITESFGPETACRALQELIDSGLLSYDSSRGEYSFWCSIFAEAVREGVPADERRNLSQRLADRIESGKENITTTQNLRLMRLLKESGLGSGDEQWKSYALSAGKDLLANKEHEKAARVYEAVVRTLEERPRSNIEAYVLVGYADALMNLGRQQEGIKYYSEAFAYFSSHNDQEGMIRSAVTYRYHHPGTMRFDPFFEQTMKQVPDDLSIKAEVLLSYGNAMLNLCGDFPEAERNYHLARELSMKNGNTDTQARVLIALSHLEYVSGRPEKALELLSHAEEICPHDSGCYSEVLIRYGKIINKQATGCYDGNEYELERMKSCVRQVGYASDIGLVCYLCARTAVQEGRWAVAREEIAIGLETQPDHTCLLLTGAHLEYITGDFERGDRFVNRILEIQRKTPLEPNPVHLHAAAGKIIGGKIHGRCFDVPRCISLLQSLFGGRQVHPFLKARACILLLLLSDYRMDRSLAQEVYPQLISLESYYFVRPFYRERALGLGAHAFGDHDRAVLHLEKSSALAERYGDRVIRAWIDYDLGRLSGKPHMSRRYLTRALGTAVELGMPPLVERSRDVLHQLDCEDEHVHCSHFHLSNREREVLTLAAEGRTNTEIAEELSVSINTVANHMKHILKKTGSSTRTGAVAAARRTGLFAP